MTRLYRKDVTRQILWVRQIGVCGDGHMHFIPGTGHWHTYMKAKCGHWTTADGKYCTQCGEAK